MIRVKPDCVHTFPFVQMRMPSFCVHSAFRCYAIADAMQHHSAALISHFSVSLHSNAVCLPVIILCSLCCTATAEGRNCFRRQQNSPLFMGKAAVACARACRHNGDNASKATLYRFIQKSSGERRTMCLTFEMLVSAAHLVKRICYI